MFDDVVDEGRTVRVSVAGAHLRSVPSIRVCRRVKSGRVTLYRRRIACWAFVGVVLAVEAGVVEEVELGVVEVVLVLVVWGCDEP